MKFEIKPYKLINTIQHYDWGTRNDEAFIPQLLGRKVEKDVPYAELWIGAHSKAPSVIDIDGSRIALDLLIKNFPKIILGEKYYLKYDYKLPFLFKVLSAGEALSIQAHPNKKQAELLHKRDPKNYPDDNHKPEIAIALDRLVALIGFRPVIELIESLKRYPELTEFIGQEETEIILNSQKDSDEHFIRSFYTALMNKSLSHEKELEKSLSKLEKRLTLKNDLSPEEKLFLQLRRKYKTDVGLFSLFILNYIELSKGQGIFLSAGVPHAYLKGNIIECMANSDNVIRAGLTPKYKDIRTLTEMLNYKPGKYPVIEPQPEAGAYIYEVPINEFFLQRTALEKREIVEMPDIESIRIILVMNGSIKIRWKSGGKNGLMQGVKGESILIPAALRDCRIEALEKTLSFTVSIGNS
ncbi:MAG: mannose-6-phosphate isomerase, class I [Calditrichaceae bacterium]|nr:mannose-6-phosphate isomerase, class I [Calditrichaceae bacterium]MBN2710356.1 mannose-6-phosphate isomerase, class I [Calditrichaceae bacterium]RQV95105.1 MAG: mannose-6-phosphate isomerase, class I [Calditrichota bacterium]